MSTQPAGSNLRRSPAERTPMAVTPPPAPAPGKPVSYEAYQAVVAEKATLEGQVSEWRGKAEAEGARFTTFSELSGALGSTDPDVISTFDGKYRALPEKDRPARGAWVEGLKAKPDDAPAVLRPWLAAPTTQAEGGTPKPPQPKVPGTPATPPGAPATHTAEEIRRVREKAVQTGDWSKWKEMRASFGGKGSK